MSEQDILVSLEAIQKDILDIKMKVSQCPKRKQRIPSSDNPAGRKWHCFSRKLRGGFMGSEIRATVMQLKKEGKRFEDVAVYIREHWPGQPEKHPSRSAIHRFYQDAQRGRLREFGIEPPVEL